MRCLFLKPSALEAGPPLARALTVLVMLALLPLGCDGGSSTTPLPVADVVDDPTDVPPGKGDTLPADEVTDPDEAECYYPRDCGPLHDCRDGLCITTIECVQRRDCGEGEVCLDGRCLAYCSTDLDCHEDGHCLDGECFPYPADLWTAPPFEPAGDGPTGLRAGVGIVDLDYPIGVSLAGYGARGVAIESEYRCSITGSDRQLERQTVKAVAFDDGHERVILIRTPTSWVNDHMVSGAAHKLNELRGKDYLDRIVLFATHSHSQPARYEMLATGEGLGQMGMGDFSIEVFDRLTKSLAHAADLAIEDLSPARLSFASLGSAEESYDPDGLVTWDRRKESPPFKYPRLSMVRVDDPDGHPRALMVHLPIHGVYLFHGAVSGDIPGAIESITEYNLRQRLGRHVPVLYMNGPAGNVSPAGEWWPGPLWNKVLRVGYRAWPFIESLYESLEGQGRDDITLRRGMQRVPLSYDHLGYDRDKPHPDGEGKGEFYDAVFGSHRGEPYCMGALMCVGAGDDDWDNYYQDGALQCLISVKGYIGYPLTQLMKTRLAVIGLGDLVFLTLPGEPNARYGVDLEERVREATGSELALVLGYSMDHLFYLMDEDDWWRGGYEPSMSPWGWKLGDYLADKSAALADMVWAGQSPPATDLKPSWWEDAEERLRAAGILKEHQPWLREPVWHEVEWRPTATEDVGHAIDSPPEEVRRMEAVEFTYEGGHPGVDLPVPTLERREGDEFVPVLFADGAPYDNSYFHFVVHFRGTERQPSPHAGRNVWSIRWQEGPHFPAGVYRMRVTGRYYDGTTPGVATPYETKSEPFELRPREDIVVHEVIEEGDDLVVIATYPPPPTTADREGPFDELIPTGHFAPFLDRAGFIGGTLPHDLTVKLNLDSQEFEADEVEFVYPFPAKRDEEGEITVETMEVTVTRLRLAHPGPGLHTLQVVDPHGNTGTRDLDFLVR